MVNWERGTDRNRPAERCSFQEKKKKQIPTTGSLSHVDAAPPLMCTTLRFSSIISSLLSTAVHHSEYIDTKHPGYHKRTIPCTLPFLLIPTPARHDRPVIPDFAKNTRESLILHICQPTVCVSSSLLLRVCARC